MSGSAWMNSAPFWSLHLTKTLRCVLILVSSSSEWTGTKTETRWWGGRRRPGRRRESVWDGEGRGLGREGGGGRGDPFGCAEPRAWPSRMGTSLCECIGPVLLDGAWLPLLTSDDLGGVGSDIGEPTDHRCVAASKHMQTVKRLVVSINNGRGWCQTAKRYG